MSDSNKGKSGKGGAKTAAASKSEASEDAPEPSDNVEEEKAELEAAHEAAVEAHDKAHPPHGAGGHAHKPNIKEYMVIFAVLGALTALEVGVAQVPGVSRKLIAVTLIGLALTKAAIVGLYYMHLKHETRVLKLTVALPMAAPTIYAIVLISEAAWRLTRW
jgi:cytochrome c oxidase subunit 4